MGTACHAEARSWEDTDWLQILLLYDEIGQRDPAGYHVVGHR